MKLVGEAGEFVFKALWSVVDRNAKVNTPYFNVPDYPTPVMAIYIVDSNEIVVFNRVGSDASGKLTYQPFTFQEKEAVVFGKVCGIVLCGCPLCTKDQNESKSKRMNKYVWPGKRVIHDNVIANGIP